jgi:anti-sigma factor RsiW
MSCDPVRVTGYVDRALSAEELAAMEAHLEGCAECARQVEEERALGARLRELPAPVPRDELEAEVRRRLAPAPRSVASWALPLAASLVLLLLWARGSAAFVAWELARDHRHCFGQERLPAQVWSEDPGVVERWFEKQGTELPIVPEGAGGLELVGGRYCTLLDRGVAHLYYSAGEHQASLFVLRGPARLGTGYEGRMGARTVMVFPAGGVLVGVVADRSEDAAALRRRFQTTTAALQAPEAP